MIRRLFNFVSVVSLLLCVVTIALWVRSYRTSDSYGISQRLAVTTESGEFVVLAANKDSNFSAAPGYSHEEVAGSDDTYNPRRVARRTWNFIVAHGEEFPGVSIIVIQLWGIAVLLVFPFVVAVIRWGLQSHAKMSCGSCRYNLTGNTSGVCPECGTPVPSKPEAVA